MAPHPRRIDFVMDGEAYCYLLTPAFEVFRDYMLWFLQTEMLVERITSNKFPMPPCIKESTLYRRFRALKNPNNGTELVSKLFSKHAQYGFCFLIASAVMTLFLVRQKKRRSVPFYLTEAMFGESRDDAYLAATVRHVKRQLEAEKPGSISSIFALTRESVAKRIEADLARNNEGISELELAPYTAGGEVEVNRAQLEKVLHMCTNAQIEETMDTFRAAHADVLFNCRVAPEPEEVLSIIIRFIGVAKTAFRLTAPSVRDMDPARILVVVAHLVAASCYRDDQELVLDRFSLMHWQRTLPK